MGAPLLQRYGNFVLLRLIGTGDVAETFRAKVAAAKGLDRDVAVKRLLPRFADDISFVEVFASEATAATKLTHKNIVRVFEVGVVGASCFIAMELVDGVHLGAVAERAAAAGRPLTPAQCARIASGVAGALHHIHTRRHRDQALNLVHRDVSPTNILVEWTGEVKLTDFGIARAKQRLTQTQAGLVRGKCEYASPEQVGGQAIDGRADLFSLGIVLWELLAGRRLFAADNEYDTLKAVLKGDIPSLREVNPAVPEELDRILSRLLERDLERRTSSAGELQHELDRFCAALEPASPEGTLGELVQDLFGDDIREQFRLQTEEREAYHAFLEANNSLAAPVEIAEVEVADAPPSPTPPPQPPLSATPATPPTPREDAAAPPRPSPAASPPAALDVPADVEPPADMDTEEEAATKSRVGAWLGVITLGGIAAALIWYYVQLVWAPG